MYESTFRRRGRTWSFHVVVLQRRTKKCTTIYNARTQLLFYRSVQNADCRLQTADRVQNAD